MHILTDKIKAIHEAEAAYVRALLEVAHLIPTRLQEQIVAEYIARQAGKPIHAEAARETKQDTRAFVETL